MSGELAGRVAIVTGGGSGIGRAIAVALAGAGASVAVCGRARGPLDETAALVAAAGGTSRAIVCDVTDCDAVRATMSDVERALGPIHTLVNNAGTLEAIGLPWEVDPEGWWRDVETSLRGTFLWAHAVLPGMIERGGGVVVNIASEAAAFPDPHTSGYAAAKAAVAHLSGSLAAACAPHRVEVFAVSPGTVRTAITLRLARDNPSWAAWFASRPDAEWDPPERVAALVVELASGRGEGLSGRFLDAQDDLDDVRRRRGEDDRDELSWLRRARTGSRGRLDPRRWRRSR